jgi:hypothetical protein
MDAMKDQELLKEIKDRFREAHDAVDSDYNEAIEDLNFAYIPGSQWSTEIKSERIRDGRPCFEINKVPYFIDQVVGDIRQNEPSIKIKPVDSKADPKTAEIFTGLIRNIEVQNDAEIAYDTAAESAVACGYGAWRVNTQYSENDQFDQDIVILRIRNPFTIYWDPSAQKWDKSDARYCFITEKIPMDQFKKDYPDSSLMSFEASKDKNPLWGDGKMIRIVEYFTREIEKKKLYLMQNREGQLFVTKEEPDMERLPEFGWQLMKERDVESHEVKWCKANQSEILEKQTKWPGKYIPIVMVYGKEINIEGKTKYRGMVRYGKDSQRLYNMFRSTGAEVIALTPKSPYLVTSKMISNYQSKWDTAHKKNYPYLPYDPDPSNAQLIPRRAEPIMASSGIAQEVNIADQEMHDTLGLQQSSLGQKSNEKSGRAIMARQKEGDTAQYPYYDNLGRAMKYEARILIDLIPKIYDTARIIRIMNEDGSGSFVPVNQPFVEQGQNGGEAIQRIYDLAVGKYDAMVSIGPSFTTQREEAAQSMIAFIEAVPAAAPLIGDLLAKNLDWPGAQEIEKRLKLLLPPQLQGGEGGQPPKPPPPDVNQIMAQRGEAAKIQGNELDNEMKFHQMERLKRGQTPEPKEAKQ